MHANELKLLVLLADAIVAWLITSRECPAQVVLDGTMGRAGALSGPAYQITPDLGRQVGQNLFHSFSQFNLATGDSATFSGPPDVQNIISRVTGGMPSSIDGLIRSTILGANFYLINPSGVMFGPNASLDVSGSFVVTTADYLKLADGGRFDARNPENCILTAAPIEKFGFLTAEPKAITIEGLFDSDYHTLLNVTAGKTLSLVGGDLRLANCELLAPRGRIALVSVRSEGEVSLDVDDPASVPQTEHFAQLGDITLSDNTFLDTEPLFWPGPTGPSGGKVVVRGGNLSMSAATIDADTLDQDGLGVDIAVRHNMVLKDGGGISAGSFGTGKAGEIDIRTGSLQIYSAAGIGEAAFGDATAGEIRIQAGSILIDGHIGKDQGVGPTGIFGSTVGASDAGNIILKTGTLELKGGAFIDAATSPNILSDGPAGNGGSISVTADKVHMTGGSSISTRSDSEGQGGSIKLATGDLIMEHGSTIESSSTSSGASGSISVEARGSILLTQGSQISTEAAISFANGITLSSRGNIELHDSQINARASQDGGNISLTSPSVIYVSNGRITTEAGGNGGNITIDPRFVLLNDSQITANAIAGNGGNITLNTSYLIQSPDSLVSASSQFGLNGQISILGPSVDFSGSLVRLPGGFGGAVSRLPERCAVRLPGDFSSFISVGRGGLPLEPGDLQPSLLLFDDDKQREQLSK